MDCEFCGYHPQEAEWEEMKVCQRCFDFFTEMEAAPPDFLDSVRVTMIAQEAGI